MLHATGESWTDGTEYKDNVKNGTTVYLFFTNQ